MVKSSQSISQNFPLDEQLMNYKLLFILGILRKGFILNMDTIVLDFLEGHVEVENFLDFISQEIN